MKVGLFLVLFSNEKFEAALDRAKKMGVEAVEIGTGNYPGDAHCKVAELLKSAEAREDFLYAIRGRGLEISALSCHGNMLHPDPKIGQAHHQIFEKTIQLAGLLGVKTVINFSGTPGGGPGDKVPNWITCPWPNDFSNALKWQWEKKLVPYWKKMAKLASHHGVKIALEMHPGMSVYNPESLLKLRNACGKNIGCNMDPSHLFWQGIDPMKAIRALGACVYHVHAKDTKIYDWNSDVNGVLDTKSYMDEAHRSWIFRTVGYGHGMDFWADFISTLRMTGYDGSLSIEHEDSLMSGNEGLRKAIAFLKDVVIQESLGKAWWV